jgi:3-deoxy-D-manno-octulosonic-acid transferase
MFYLLYDILLGFLALIAFPKMFFQMLRHNKYKLSFKQRWGIQSIQKGQSERFTVWIHAVSVGETKAVAAIAKKIKEQHPHARLIVSTITETGQAEAKRSIPMADEYLFLPFDFSWVVKPVVNTVKPQLVILSESDFWLNFLRFSKECGANIVLVNGKLSNRSFQRFSWLKSLANRIFSSFDLMCVQNIGYAKLFEELGVPKEKIVVTGNLKFDQDYPFMSLEEKSDLKDKLALGEGWQLLVLGSTHAPEEDKMLKMLNKVWNLFPRLKVLIVPRHPERFQEVAQIIEKNGVPFLRFSDLQKQKAVDHPVVLMDAMGLLKKCYQLADLAVVGGSFVTHVGGHNILEPCGYGVPVLFGPHMFAQEELVNLTLHAQAGLQVTIEELDKAIVTLLEEGISRRQMGLKGLKLMEDNRGSSQRTWKALEPVLNHAMHQPESITKS